MTTAVDFAWSVPPIPVLQQLGVVAVGRYVGPASWGKTIQQPEFDAYQAAGIAVWLVFEAGANDAMGGFAAGVANARLALANAPAGYTGAIFMACDQDLRGADLQTAVDYIHGASTVLGSERTGDYGPGALCAATDAAGFAKYHWQSGSTSFNGNGSTLPITQIQQGVGNPIPGYDTDPNTLLAPDYGQHPRPDPTPSPAQVLEDFMDTIQWPTAAADGSGSFYWRSGVADDGTLVADVQALPSGAAPVVNLNAAVGALPAHGCKLTPVSFGFEGTTVHQLHLDAAIRNLDGSLGFVKFTWTQGDTKWVKAA